MYVVELWDYDNDEMFDVFYDLTLDEALDVVDKLKGTLSYYDRHLGKNMEQKYIRHHRIVRRIGGRTYKGYQLILQAYPV